MKRFSTCIVLLTSCGSIGNLDDQPKTEKAQSIQVAEPLARTVFNIPDSVSSAFPNEKERDLYSFEFEIPNVSAQSLRDLQKRFGYSDRELEPVNETPSHFWSRCGSMYFELNKASGQELVANLDIYHVFSDVDWHISEDILISIAFDYILKHGDIDLSELRFDRIRYSRKMISTLENETIFEGIAEADVVFGRSIDGVPVIGPGSKCVVTISSDGRIGGFYKLWRHVASKSIAVTVASTTTSVEALIRSVSDNVNNGDSLFLSRADFGYWEDSRHHIQKYLFPVHSFIYTACNDPLHCDEFKSSFIYPNDYGPDLHVTGLSAISDLLSYSKASSIRAIAE